MAIPEEILAEIKYRNDIENVILPYVNLKRRGKNLIGLCPFHNEKTPSFTVYPENGSFYCFGCGAGGNVFTFLQQYENYSFPEAIKYLADRAGVNLPEIEYSEEARKKESKRAKLLEVNKEAAKYFYY